MSTTSKKIAIVYYSKTGATHKLAQAIYTGIQQYNTLHNSSHQVSLYAIDAKDISEGRFRNLTLVSKLSDYDALVFGSPTYMGSISAQFKAFIDATGDIWSQQAWAGKLAAGFTCGTGLNGDQSHTLISLFIFASQQGMIWLGLDTHLLLKNGLNRLGCQVGVVAHVPINNQVHEQDLATAKHLGARIAKQLTLYNIDM